MSDAYRFDRRSKRQFKKDIKEAHGIEDAIMQAWLKLVGNPKSRAIGCGPDGEFLEHADVNTDADFDVDGYGLIEVKFSKPKLRKQFHLKVRQVESYLDQDASILMVDGWETEDPTYVLIPAALLRSMIDHLEIVSWQGFGGKKAYRLPLDKFIWRPLGT